MTSPWQDTVASHRRRTREQIIEAALELVGELGMPAITMSLLAERAGVSRATLYKYFPDVQAVVLAWVTDEVDRAVQRIEEALAEGSDPLDELRRYVAAVLETFDSPEHRFSVEHLGASLSPLVAEAMAEQMARLRAILTRVLQRGADEGLLRPDLDADAQADLLMHMLGGLRLQAARDDRSAEAMADQVLDLLLRGLGR